MKQYYAPKTFMRFSPASACRTFAVGALLATSALLSPEASAVKAWPGMIEVTQPDGTVLSVYMHGDEWHNYATTADGMLLLYNESGVFEYASPGVGGVPVLSGIKARDAAERTPFQSQWLASLDQEEMMRALENTGMEARARKVRSSEVASNGPIDWVRPKYTFSTTTFPAKGSPHTIVILVEYPNKKFSMENPAEYFERFLNGDDFTDNGGTGSCIQYFKDTSMGQFTPVFDLFGPVMMEHESSYYSANEDRMAFEMVVEAVKSLDPTVDFNTYDENGDGVVDNIYLIYAGGGRATSGKADEVWPHSYDLPSVGVSLDADGVRVKTYGMSNELMKNRPDGIGTYIHEFSHVLGMPDLYNTRNSRDFTTPGPYTILDGGCYNNDGCTPPHYTAFERYALEWLTPEEIVSSGSYELEDVSKSNKAYILTSEENEDEFFILECRARQGWDAYLPGQGLLIWHVEFNQEVWDKNMPNDSPNHHYVDLLNADNRQNGSYATDPFPTDTRNSITSSSRPGLRTATLRDLNVTELNNITEVESGRVTFNAVVTEDRSSAVKNIESHDTDPLTLRGRILYYAASSGHADVYDVAGRKAGVVTADSPLSLQPGLYIACGKKFVVN